MLLTGLITPTLFYYSCLNCKAQLPIIQFRFFKIKNSILMIVCDKYYDFNDYLETFDEYKKYLKK